MQVQFSYTEITEKILQTSSDQFRSHALSMTYSSTFLLCSSVVEASPDIAMDCIIQMSQNITPSQRAKLSHLLATMDSASTN